MEVTKTGDNRFKGIDIHDPDTIEIDTAVFNTDLSDYVTVVDDDDMGAIVVERTHNNDVFIENCITCLHSETVVRSEEVILPSGCKKGVQVQWNVPMWCEEFKQFC